MIRKTGGCLCGAVKFEAEMEDLSFGACHCGMCRRWVGGPFLAKEAETVTVTDGADELNAYRSSDWAERVSCASCGSRVICARWAGATGGLTRSWGRRWCRRSST